MTPEFRAALKRLRAACPRGVVSDRGYVYFAQAGVGGPVKIGWSLSPARRVAGLQTDNPEPVALLAKLPGTPHDEAALHHAARVWRVRGEWFRGAPEVLHAAAAAVERGEACRREPPAPSPQRDAPAPPLSKARQWTARRLASIARIGVEDDRGVGEFACIHCGIPYVETHKRCPTCHGHYATFHRDDPEMSSNLLANLWPGHTPPKRS